MGYKKFASIPMPTSDPNALYNTCMAMKQQLEALTGLGGSIHAKVPTMHVHMGVPAEAEDGDFWLYETGTSTILHVQMNGKWLVVATLT